MDSHRDRDGAELGELVDTVPQARVEVALEDLHPLGDKPVQAQPEAGRREKQDGGYAGQDVKTEDEHSVWLAAACDKWRGRYSLLKMKFAGLKTRKQNHQPYNREQYLHLGVIRQKLHEERKADRAAKKKKMALE